MSENNKLRLYLDNCAYNRPYDDQSQLRISLESQAKLYIQEKIKEGKFELVCSYMSIYECSMNPYTMRKNSIMDFMENNTDIFVSDEYKIDIEKCAANIMNTGIKFKDACHVASAIFAKCDYFISPDKRLLKYHSDDIVLLSPVDFITIDGV